MAKKKMTASRSAVQDVERLAQQLADEQGVELVEVSLQKESRGKCLLVFIDREGGISLDDCRKISPRPAAAGGRCGLRHHGGVQRRDGSPHQDPPRF